MKHIDWLFEAQAIAPQLAALRAAFHQAPELGNCEFETSARIERTLQALGIETRRVLKTGVVGTMQGGRIGPCAALRADMDALSLQEQTGAVCASQTAGVMHACGHDVHMTAAIGAAMLLHSHRDELRGCVRFLFQPDEEGTGGAQRMVQEGCMQGVEAVFGAHVSPELPLGAVGVKSGTFYAASDTFEIRVRGKSCHGATPQLGVDALAAAAKLALSLKKLPQKSGQPCVLTVGTLHAGTAINVLAGEAVMTGILRTLGKENRMQMRKFLREAVCDIARETGVTAELSLHESYPGVTNDRCQTARAERVFSSLLGRKNVTVLDSPTMTTEDFGFLLDEAPGTFYHIGAGCSAPLHSPRFFPDDQAAVFGAAAHAALIADFLEHSSADADLKG